MEDVQERVAFLEGKVEVQTDMIDNIRETAARLERRFDQLEHRLDQRFAAIDQRFIGIDHRFVAMDERLDRLDTKFGWLVGLTVAVLISVLAEIFKR